MSLYKCKVCGKDMAKSAKACPSCGHRPFLRVSPVAVLLILIATAAAVGFGVNAINKEFR